MPDWTQELAVLEARLKAYIDQRLEEVLAPSQPVEVPEVPQVPQVPRRRLAIPMMPAYPDDPTKDTRLNLHISAGAAWELKAVAAVLRIEQSRLFRHIWETFLTTIEGKEALQQARDSAGMAITAGEGRQRFGEELRA